MAALDNDLKALRAEIDTLRKDFSRLAEALERTAGHGRDEAISRAHRSADWVREEANKAAHNVMEEIEGRPLTSILAVFAIGAIMGVLFSGRR